MIHFFLTKITVGGVVIPALIVTTINYFIYDLKDESYVLSCPAMYVRWKYFTFLIDNLSVFPMNFSKGWKTPIGYAMGSALNFWAGYCSLSCIVPTISFSIGCGMMINACIKHMIINLNEFRRKLKKKPNRLERIFCDIVLDFSELKELRSCQHHIWTDVFPF